MVPLPGWNLFSRSSLSVLIRLFLHRNGSIQLNLSSQLDPDREKAASKMKLEIFLFFFLSFAVKGYISVIVILMYVSWPEQTQQSAAVVSTITLPWCFMHPRGRVVHGGTAERPGCEETGGGCRRQQRQEWCSLSVGVMEPTPQRACRWLKEVRVGAVASWFITNLEPCVCGRLTAIWLFTRAFKMTCLHLSKSEQSFYILKRCCASEKSSCKSCLTFKQILHFLIYYTI